MKCQECKYNQKCEGYGGYPDPCDLISYFCFWGLLLAKPVYSLPINFFQILFEKF
uniref:Uncharacterized protein n=1 Tax=Meloidogyne enterolobii TaxID=390850 RepID=A0A6V7U5P7_MELEN|nr:unnamed protein product [Meloidogyne enterolobii]